MLDGYVVGLTADGADETGDTVFGDIGLNRLTDVGITWRLVSPDGDGGHRGPALDGLDAIISFAHMPFGVEVVRRAPRLRHVARFGAGYDGIDTVGLAHEGVVVTTAPDAVRRPLAIAALTLLLCCSTRLMENHLLTIGGRWSELRGKFRGQGVAGRTVGIIGLGSVGSELAVHLQGLGATVIATGRDCSRSRAELLGIETVSLDALAERSDYVVVAAALTDDTRGLLDADFFSAMKNSSYFINVARGAIVDQSALTAALRSGSIAGAGLDVFDPEPVAADDPLLDLPNVVLSPHALCWTADFTEAVSASVMESVLAVAEGHVPASALSVEELDMSTWRGRC